jgi:uncharacterized protein (DUF433 family)
MRTKTLTTNHPYVLKTQGVQGGQPCIKGTRIPVAALWNYYDCHGLSPREIVAQFPHLTLAAVLDALSYAAENQVEMNSILQSEKDSFNEDQ